MLFQCHYEVASTTETERELLSDSLTLRCQDLPCSIPYLPVTDSNLPFDTRHPVLSGDEPLSFTVLCSRRGLMGGKGFPMKYRVYTIFYSKQTDLTTRANRLLKAFQDRAFHEECH